MRKIKNKIMIYLINILSGTHFFKLKRTLFLIAGYKIGKNSRIVGPISIYCNIEVGDNVWIGRNFSCEGNGKVIIGNNVDIGPKVMFLTGGHQIGDINRRAGKGESYTISIGDGCWIGANTTFLKNIQIGKSCVIGACSCIINTFEDNVLICGVPGHRIKKL